eukprot:591228-Pelagomonas_calceolata.AAC.6
MRITEGPAVRPQILPPATLSLRYPTTRTSHLLLRRQAHISHTSAMMCNQTYHTHNTRAPAFECTSPSSRAMPVEAPQKKAGTFALLSTIPHQ